MSEIAIHAEKLGKLYRIGEKVKYKTLSDTLSGVFRSSRDHFKSIFQKKERRLKTQENIIWALKDVSFDVKRGEVVGIIGRNGAGKSTLLKILSRITEPTEGYAEIYGRVGSLLEVGTGFHPELTGRENIFLNGAILGMRKNEIKRKFDEIVAFAEIDKFIDTPVKYYSSGMYVRLAFAVAAHMEPEILLVDEVLAVGDFEFQKKCLGKMGDVANEGRTVFFVSHNMPVIQRLCQTACLLDQGRILTYGNAAEVVDSYYKLTAENDFAPIQIRDVPEDSVRFVSWHLKESVSNLNTCYSGDKCQMLFQLVVRRLSEKASFGLALWSEDGTLVWSMRNLDYGGQYILLKQGHYEVKFSADSLPIRPGAYQILVSVNDENGKAIDAWYAQPKLMVIHKQESGLPPQWQGVLNLRGDFELTVVNR